jgi:hypothetical protein
MIEWIKGWTFFNWITVLAFILAIYNVFFKSYYVEWQARRSKKAFEKRLEELDLIIFKVQKYIQSTKTFLVGILLDCVYPILILLAAFLFFTWGLERYVGGLSTGKEYNFTVGMIFFSICQILVFFAGFLIMKIGVLIRYVRYPELLAINVSKLVKDAKTKGFITDEESTSKINSIIDFDIYTADQKKALKDYVGM